MQNKIPHILIVDDDANLLATMHDILKVKGFEPVTAQTGAMALAQLEKYRFDIALIDLRLGDMSGLILLRGIKTHSPETQCILLTGHASQNSAIEAIQMGAYGFFQKPFDMEQLLLSIQRALEKSAAEQALRESERFAHATVDALSSHLAILDETGVILAVNRAWREFAKANYAGDPKNVCEGTNYLAVCDAATGKYSEEAPVMAAGIRAVLSGRQKEFSLEYPCHSSEEKRWFTARVTRFPGEGALRVVVAHENITERKHAEAAVLESEQRFRVIFEKANDAIHIDDANDRILAVNSRMCELLGYSREELLKMHVKDLQAPEIRRPGNVVKTEFVRNGNSVFETLNLHHDGRRIPVEISVGIIEFPGGELYISVVRDITERKEAEAALYESEERFRNAFQYSAIGMALVSLEGKWLKVNPTICSIVGYSEGELLNKTFQDITHPDDLNSDLSYLDQLLAGEIKSYTLEKRYLRKDGKIVWVLLAVALARDSAGVPLYFISQVNDITERKQAEKALQESEALYRQAIQVAGAVPYLQSYAGDGSELHYDFIGDGIHQITGYEAGEFNSVLWDSLVEESILMGDLAGYSMQEAIRLVRTGEIPLWQCETRLRARDGKIHWVFEAAVELYDENGIAKGSIGMFQDITERKEADMVLAEERNLLRTLIDILPDRIYVKDAESRFLLKNLADAHSLGVLPDAMVGKSDADYYPPEMAARFYADDQAVIQSGKPLINREEWVMNADGTLSWILTTKVPWRDSEGRIIGVVGIGHDITQRKQAEENIRKRVAELELLYESGLAFSQLLNPEQIAQKIIKLLGEKLNWHHTAIRLLRAQDELELVASDQPGLTDRAAVEVRFNNLITHVGQGLSGWALQQSKIVRSGEVNNEPLYVASYPGIHSGLYAPLKSGDHMLGVISIESEQPDAFSEADEQLLATLASQAANAFENARLYQEINRYAEELEERVKERTADLSLANANLARAVRVKDEFLASMSHELRTPLTGILGLSEALQLNVYGDLNEKQRATLKNIEESGRHLLDLINDILDLSKIEAGKLELQFAPCSLADICQASLQLIKGMAQKKNQQVHYTPSAEPIIIRADARRLKQLLVNLLSNAIKFTPQNSELGLEVQINKDERNFQLIVWDKGIGINSEELQNIFKPFVQLDSGLAREYSGTGLGLSLVQHLTKLHNGGIEVQSKIGEGSRFIISLPWSSDDTIPIPYMPKRVTTGRLVLSADHSKSPLVIFADDNETVLQMVADFLEANQYRVMKARNGSELLEQVAEFHPDIILVDIQMPGIGGLETIRRIRSHPDLRISSTPVIAVTALAMPADRERCLRAGANEYMSKPLRLKSLAAAIKKLLEREP